jgi:hypothetical protein
LSQNSVVHPDVVFLFIKVVQERVNTFETKPEAGDERKVNYLYKPWISCYEGDGEKGKPHETQQRIY